MPLQRLVSADAMAALSHELHYPDLTALYAAVGEGHASARHVIQRLTALLGGEEQASRVYGIFAATAFAANAAGSALAPAVARRLGGARAAALASFAAGAAILLVASPFLALVGAGYVAVYLMLGVGGPLASELLHGRVAAAQRTTMLSVESLALQVGGVVANLSLGAIVVATSLGWGFACIAAAMVAGGALLLTRPFRQAAAVVDLARPAPAHEAG